MNQPDSYRPDLVCDAQVLMAAIWSVASDHAMVNNEKWRLGMMALNFLQSYEGACWDLMTFGNQDHMTAYNNQVEAYTNFVQRAFVHSV